MRRDAGRRMGMIRRRSRQLQHWRHPQAAVGHVDESIQRLLAPLPMCLQTSYTYASLAIGSTIASIRAARNCTTKQIPYNLSVTLSPCGGIHGKLLMGNSSTRKILILSALPRNFVGKFLQRLLFEPPSRSGVFQNQDAAIVGRDLGSFPCLQRRKHGTRGGYGGGSNLVQVTQETQEAEGCALYHWHRRS